jgi:hydrogenase maturation protease
MSQSDETESILVIGYGNELRCDDGIGPYFAREIDELGLPHVRVLTVQQLLPELAEELAAVQVAIFVDACLESDVESVRVTRVDPTPASPNSPHTSSPTGLLMLAQTLYGQTPETWLISVRGAEFDLGEGLSPVAKVNASKARNVLVELINNHRCQSAHRRRECQVLPKLGLEYCR